MLTRALWAILLLALLLVTLTQLARLVHGRRVGYSPLWVFLFVWSGQIAVVVANPLDLFVPQVQTVLILAGGIASFVVGYATGFRLLPLPGPSAGPPVLTRDVRPAATLTGVFTLLGGALLALLVLQLVRAYGLQPARALYELRVALGRGEAPSGFYFFYFLTPVVPLGLLLGRLTGIRWWYALSAASTVALLATSGRTNAITAMIWALGVLFLLRGPARVTARQLLVVVLVLVTSLGGFLALGSALGKTYDNSVFAVRFGDNPPLPKPIVIPALYVAAPIPTLDQQLQRRFDEGAPRNTARPLLQLLSIPAPRIEVPDKIQSFDYTPYPHNVATYVSPLYRDGGVLGVLLGSWVLGAVSGAAFASWLRRPTPTLGVLVALVTTIDLATINDAVFTELSVLLQFGLLTVAVLAERQRAAARAQRDGTTTAACD